MKNEEISKAVDVLENIESRLEGLIKHRQVTPGVIAFLKEFVLNADLKQTLVNLKSSLVEPNTNLIEKYKDSDIRERFGVWSSKHKVLEVDPRGLYHLGQVVRFMGGYHGNIEFTSEILGFDEDGKSFMLWDCYWFPVDLKEREVK